MNQYISFWTRNVEALTGRNDVSKTFPSPYHYASAEDTEALARRAARFQKSSKLSTTAAAPFGVGGWFADDDEDNGPVHAKSADIMPGQVGRKKLKGKGGLGYSGEEVMEVDPVSDLAGLVAFR